MNLTQQQIDFADAVIEGEDNVTLVARAGTGKTSTIIVTTERCVREQPHKTIMLCAYNKTIERELTERLTKLKIDPSCALAKTAHASGLSLITAAYGFPQINDKKIPNILKHTTWNGRNLYLIDQYFPQICKLVGFAKNSGFGYYKDIDVNSDDPWFALADHYGINGVRNDNEMRGLFHIARIACEQSLEITQEIDFDDMILLPLVKGLKPRRPYKRLFVDEAQDLSRARQDLMKLFVCPIDGRMYIVGDDRQAIYGFSGADAQALHNLTASLKAKELPLTVTWRCARKIVEHANEYVEDLEAAPNAPEGFVGTVDALPQDIQPGDAILCRFNAPLIEYAFKLIRAGIPARVEGREIGKGLLNLARRWKTRDIAALLERLEEYKANEINKARQRGSESKEQEVTDRVDTLVAICMGVLQRGKKGVDDVTATIEQLFGDDISPKQAVTLSSVHKAKGREWDRVVFLDKPVTRQLKAWEEEQEKNLRYVAITRAKSTLLFLPIVSEPKPKWN